MSCFCCSEDPVISAYNRAKIVEPPKHLDPIFVDRKQTDETLSNLAMAYFAAKYNEQPGVQLFEIPPISDNCRQFCGRSYNPDTKMVSGPMFILDDRWKKLASKVDFSCREGFRKIFAYKGDGEGQLGNHWSEQWGDGTSLHKMGRTEIGATPVIRLIDPNHSKITKDYGKVKAIWICPCDHVPEPFFRFQSTNARGEVIPGQGHQTKEAIERRAGNQWKACFEELVKKRDALREEALEKKE